MTIKDVAQLAGVSIATVSRSLNDRPEVSQRTRERVLTIAREHGFEQSAVARGLVMRKVGTIGIILPDDFEQFKTQLYHASLHNHLRRSLERSNFDLLVGFSRNRATGENSIRKLVSRRKVDGLILFISALDKETEKYLKNREVPYVYAHYPPKVPRVDVDWVYVDHSRGGMLVGEYFVRRGFRRIGVASSPSPVLEFALRIEGLNAALQNAETRPEVISFACDGSYEQGYELGRREIDQFRSLEAVFAVTDLSAIGLLHAFLHAGMRVPEDISVIGYDDSPLAERMRPFLTTVRQPAEDVAHLTCERLVEMIEDLRENRQHVSRQIALQPSFIERETTV